ELSQRRDVSDNTAQIVDTEIKRFLDEAYANAESVLTENRVLLDAIANALLDRETLDADEIKLLDAGEPLPPVPEVVAALPAPEPPVVHPAPRSDESPLGGPGGEPSPALA
ncbi:MAG: cell division protein FtsH, partial [Gemmatimonadota bacterium]|nr:cell division protein FtsH [Gemmatimonadota bacterium]